MLDYINPILQNVNVFITCFVFPSYSIITFTISVASFENSEFMHKSKVSNLAITLKIPPRYFMDNSALFSFAFLYRV